MLGLSAFLFAGFSKSRGVATDDVTSLQWQDDYSDNAGNIKTATWAGAIDYCEASTLGGYTDWRLPNAKELLSIVDYATYNPAISSVFRNTNSNNNKYWWSSTTNAKHTSSASSVEFYNGITQSFSKTFTYNVRCVR